MKLPRFLSSSNSGRIPLTACVLIGASLVLSANSASAFPHVAQSGETLASLAELFYGRIQFERVLATANSLDSTKSKGLTPGMVIEIPSLSYHQVQQGDTWKSLALALLGDEQRYILLAQINGHKPWVEPELGQLIALPYNLSWFATGKESLATLAYRFLGSTKHAYRLVTYNDLGERDLERGEVLLIPLSELPLTDEGRAAAEIAATQISEQARGTHFAEQRKSVHAAKELADEVRGGRYVSAVTHGTRLLTAGKLTQPARAAVHLLLLEAYVALDARGLARISCESYRSLEPRAILDPLTTSPKILRVCGASAKPSTALPKPSTALPKPSTALPKPKQNTAENGTGQSQTSRP